MVSVKPNDAENDRVRDGDDDVLRLIDARDLTAALRVLMQRYGTAVYRYCREALRDPALADDVHQQVFIQAHRDLTRFKRESKIRTWLFAIARHRVLDAAKSRQRAHAHVEHDERADVVDPQPLVRERIDDARLRHALTACLEKLDEHLRTEVLLRYQQGLSYPEIAEMHKPNAKEGELRKLASTIEARVRRALPTLRDCIEDCTGGKV